MVPIVSEAHGYLGEVQLDGEKFSDSVVVRAAERVTITVPDLPLRRVLARAIAHYNARARDGARPAGLGSDPRFLARIAVNWLRHASQYDDARDTIRGHAAAAEAGLIVKARTLRQIARMYPTFAEECARQEKQSGLP